MSLWQRLRRCGRRPTRPACDIHHSPSETSSASKSEWSDEENAPPDVVPFEITDILDLHQFAPRDTAEVVRTYLEEARAKGFTTVRIIHGKGIGAQRQMVHSILGKTSFVRQFQDAPAEAGGWGATIVWFRNNI